MSEIKCQICDVIGHQAIECPKRYMPLGPSSNIPNSPYWAPYYPPPSPWYYPPPPPPAPWYYPPPPPQSTTDLPPSTPVAPQSTPKSTEPSRPLPSRSQSTAKSRGQVLLPRNTDVRFALHVGNLDRKVTESDLKALFSTISADHKVYIPKDRVSGKSLCYAYVNFTDHCKAAEALVRLNNHKLEEKPIRVTWSKRNPYFRDTGIGNLFVKNISLTTTDEQFQSLFGAYGSIASCKIAKDQKGKNRMFGYVQFDKEESARNAIDGLNGFEFNGKKLYVGKYLQRSQRNEYEPASVYVKFIDSSITEAVLLEKFQVFGKVESAFVVSGANGESAGYGFVKFADHEDALKAIEGLDGVEIDGYKWDVKRGYVKRSDTKEKDADDVPASNLLVMNISRATDEEELKELFGAFGQIHIVRLLCSKDDSSCGMVSFFKAEDADKALSELNGHDHKGQCLLVKPFRPVDEYAKVLQDKGYVVPN